jgi:hypothetical protein
MLLAAMVAGCDQRGVHGGGLWVSNESAESYRVRIVYALAGGETDHFTLVYAVTPQSNGLLGSGRGLTGAVVDVFDPACQPLFRWEGDKDFVGLRIAADGSIRTDESTPPTELGQYAVVAQCSEP